MYGLTLTLANPRPSQTLDILMVFNASPLLQCNSWFTTAATIISSHICQINQVLSHVNGNSIDDTFSDTEKF